MEVCRVFQGANVAVLGADALGGVVAKGQAFGALGVWAKGQVALDFELLPKE